MAKRAVLIAGPTASGKSALALEKARETDGVIVNADSMQVYDTLNVLTARPTPQDLFVAEHRLYGMVPPSVRFSTGGWLAEVANLIQLEASRTLIFAGGTGLYFDALTRGFTAAPEVPDEVMARWTAEIRALDGAARRALLERLDPAMARQLTVADPQRVARALGVLEVTGRSLVEWQADERPALLDGWDVERIVLNPDRDILADRIARRFDAMLDRGAVEEVKTLLELDLDPSLPAMKAIGVREISDWLDGRTSRDAAVDRAVIATRQYAKRQRTWFRNRMGDWTWIN